MFKLFTRHPKKVGETYFQHARVAFRFSYRCAKASFCAFSHALLPFMFECTAGDEIEAMYRDLKKRR